MNNHQTKAVRNAREVAEEVAKTLFTEIDTDFNSMNRDEKVQSINGLLTNGRAARIHVVTQESEGDNIFAVMIVPMGANGSGFRFSVFSDEATPHRLARFTGFYKNQMEYYFLGK